MSELDAFVPDRIPELIGQAGDVNACIVDQVEINIATRGEFGTAIPTDRNERCAFDGGIGGVPQPDDPLIDTCRQCPTEDESADARIVKQCPSIELGSHHLRRSLGTA